MHKKRFPLNIKRFINVYNGSCKEAAVIAGISYGYARKLMLRVDVIEAIAKRSEKETPEVKSAIFKRQEIEIFLTKTIRDPCTPVAVMLRSIDLFCKMNGWYSEKRVLEGNKDNPVEVNTNARHIAIEERKRMLGMI